MKTFNFVDSHAHFDRFMADGIIDDILQRAEQAGVTRIVAVGGNLSANRNVLKLRQERPDMFWGAVGFDRDQTKEPPDLNLLKSQLAEVEAVGEIGLDYHYHPETASTQRALFDAMLAMARAVRLPVIIHSREADEDTLSLLRDHVRQWRGEADCIGVLHCFTRSAEFARAVLDLGLMISFSGIVTFRNAEALREVARIVPEDRLLIETDCPYLAPEPHRGRTNEPAYVPLVAARLADIRDCQPAHIADITYDNAQRLFEKIGAAEP
jgi:TatD DNase family protein